MTKDNHLDLRFAPPVSEDGLAVNRLIAACPPLDTNSVYCNLLQCHHFAGTSVKVEAPGGDSGDELVGFTSGYRIPGRETYLFVWQVAVSERARGHGLGMRMIRHLLERTECRDITTIETTITPDNKASWRLFEKLADALDCELNSKVLFGGDSHFGGGHKDEVLVTVGPFSTAG